MVSANRVCIQVGEIMKAHPAEIIARISELKGVGSQKSKASIIKEHLNMPEFVNLVHYALNPFKNFYVTTVPGLSEIATKARRTDKEVRTGYKDLFDDETARLPWGKQFSTMYGLLDRLANRQLAPNSSESRTAILEWAKKVGPGTISVFRMILHKDLRCGLGSKTFNKVKPGWIPSFDVQLAQPFNEKKLVFPCYVDPKFDGERCLAFITVDGSDAEVTYFSRNGEQKWNYGCFSNDLLRLFRGQGCVVADCEVTHKAGFQAGQKVPVHHDPNFKATGLQLVMFDWMPQDAFSSASFDLTQKERYTELSKLFKGFNSDRLLFVDTRIANDYQEALAIFEYWVDKGLEGIILKQPDGKYEFKRSYSWMKLKPTRTEDLKIVGMELGDPKRKWKDKFGSLVVERTSSHGDVVRVNVASGFTEQHHENIVELGDQILYTNPDGEVINLKGRTIEVSFDCETEDGSLRFPRINSKRYPSIIRIDK